MICYKDKTFCTYYKECRDGISCHRAFTPYEFEQAKKWWGGDNFPLSVFQNKPKCFVE